jgi:hypothetical protein
MTARRNKAEKLNKALFEDCHPAGCDAMNSVRAFPMFQLQTKR